MIGINPEVVSELRGVDLIAFGTGDHARRILPYLVLDPNIRLLGVTNSRVQGEYNGTFMETGLPIRSLSAWAKLCPHATILMTPYALVKPLVEICEGFGFHQFRFVTPKMLNMVMNIERQVAESQGSKIFEHLCLANELHDIHKTSFSEFRACNKGKTVVVVGTGPTLSYYNQIEGALHIGVNSSFLKDDLALDYYFLLHYELEWCKKLKDYHFIKFFNINRRFDSKDQFPEQFIEENNGRRFFSMSDVPGVQIHTNLECYPLMGFESIIFRAIHFALFTMPERIIFVGCDCSKAGHFDLPPEEAYEMDRYISAWMIGYREVKKFASFHYPNTELISLNPVGLKGLFRDMYTESYLDAHSELNRKEYKIF